MNTLFKTQIQFRQLIKMKSLSKLSLNISDFKFFSTRNTKQPKKSLKLKSKEEVSNNIQKTPKIVKESVTFDPFSNTNNELDNADPNNEKEIRQEMDKGKINYAATYITLKIPDMLDLFKLRDIFYTYLFIKQNDGKLYLNILDDSKIKQVNLYKFNI